MDIPVGLRPAAEAFSGFYERSGSAWGGSSGPGSSPYYALEYRAFLEKFIKLNEIGSIVDYGCGDWRFSRFINFEAAKYIGFDVVPGIVEQNISHFKAEFVDFQMTPEDPNLIPRADLLIIKDVLQHLPDAQIFELERQLFGRFRHVLLTNSFEKMATPRNVDINVGAFRCLDLAAPPYSFPGSYVLEFSSAVWERIRTFLYRG